MPILFIGQTKRYPIDFPTFDYMKTTYNVSYQKEESINEGTTSANNYLKRELGSQYINILDQKVNQISLEKYPYIYDNNHLTYYGTEQYRDMITKAILTSIK